MEVNTYIMYLDKCKQGPNPVTTPMTHLQFKNALCEALLVGWVRHDERRNETLTHIIVTSVNSNSCVEKRGAMSDITKPY
jgi:hypothetical protein